jgi:tetratricopeptide (TPR) repeat protein
MNAILKIFFTAIFWFFSFLFLAQGNDFLLGKACIDKNEFAQAVKYLDIHISNFPKHQEARLLRAKANLNLSNFSKVIEDLSTIKTDKNNEKLLLEARTYAGLGDKKLAFEKLKLYSNTSNKIAEEIIKNYPEFIVLTGSEEWANLWKSWKYSDKESAIIDIKYALKSGRNEEAADRLDMFLNRYKTNDEAYFLRANVYLEKKDYKNALIYIESAIQIDNSEDYLLSRAKILHLLQRDKRALEEYNTILNNDSLSVLAYLGRAEVNLALSYNENALNDIQKFRKYYPENTDAQYIEANIEAKSGDYLNAISNYGKLIAANPSKPEYFIGRADSYANTKTYFYAIKDYSMALDLDPKNAETFKKKALVHQLMGDIKNACNNWEHAAKLGDIESLNNFRKYCK